MLSIWEKESFFAPSDLLIIGSGFTGLWAAYFLGKKAPKLSIAIADAGPIPSGASTRNAGFACFGSPTELLRDAAAMGVDRMLELVDMRIRGISKILEEFGRKAIDGVFQGGYELINSSTASRYSDLEDRVRWLNKLLAPVVGKRQLFRFADDSIEKFGFAGARHLIHNSLEGGLHPGKLCLALLRVVQGKGVRILPSLRVTSLQQDGKYIRVQTQSGPVLSARQVLICTNGLTRTLMPELDVIPARGQVLLTAPIENLPFSGSFHAEEGFYYFRNLGNRLLLGGARHLAIQEEATTEMAVTSKIQEALEDFLQRHVLPGRKVTITDRWSGIMGMGTEKMPIVRSVSPGVVCAVRMSGMGVALAPVLAQKASDLLT